MTLIAVPEILREKLGRDGAEALVGILNDNILAVAEERFENRITITEEKFERHLSDEIGKLRVEMHDEIGKVRAEIIKWMFIFWIGQFASITAVLFLFFKR